MALRSHCQRLLSFSIHRTHRCLCTAGGKKTGDGNDNESDKQNVRDDSNNVSESIDKKVANKDLPEPSEAGQYRDPWKLMKLEFKNLLRPPDQKIDLLPVPRVTDIVIIGGGAIGSSVAYWLKQRNPKGYQVTVIERDPTYSRSATALSVGGIRQQFSLSENIQMSMFSAEFLRNIREYLSIYDAEPPDIHFSPQGFLLLASEKEAAMMEENNKLQRELGAKVDLMTPEKIKEKWPWINVEGISVGSYGVANEGWFDPWLYLKALRDKATSLGANYVKGEVVGFRHEIHKHRDRDGNVASRKQLMHVEVRADNGLVYPMKFTIVINCAGPWAAEIAHMAGIGRDEGVLQVPLPVEERKRYVYVLHCPDGPGLDTPFIVDHSGMYLRREGLGGHYICGGVPEQENAGCDHNNHGVESGFFHEHVAPALYHRAPVFKSANIKCAWAGYIDYNGYDENLILSNHPYHRNFFMAVGTCGHSVQQSPAIGRAMMEYLIEGEFKTIDLSKFSFDRILDNERLSENSMIL